MSESSMASARANIAAMSKWSAFAASLVDSAKLARILACSR